MPRFYQQAVRVIPPAFVPRPVENVFPYHCARIDLDWDDGQEEGQAPARPPITPQAAWDALLIARPDLRQDDSAEDGFPQQQAAASAAQEWTNAEMPRFRLGVAELYQSVSDGLAAAIAATSGFDTQPAAMRRPARQLARMDESGVSPAASPSGWDAWHGGRPSRLFRAEPSAEVLPPAAAALSAWIVAPDSGRAARTIAAIPDHAVQQVPTAFVANAWVLEWRGPGGKPFPIGANRFDDPVLGAYNANVITYPDGWRVADEMPRARRWPPADVPSEAIAPRPAFSGFDLANTADALMRRQLVLDPGRLAFAPVIQPQGAALAVFPDSLVRRAVSLDAQPALPITTARAFQSWVFCEAPAAQRRIAEGAALLPTFIQPQPGGAVLASWTEPVLMRLNPGASFSTSDPISQTVAVSNPGFHIQPDVPIRPRRRIPLEAFLGIRSIFIGVRIASAPTLLGQKARPTMSAADAQAMLEAQKAQAALNAGKAQPGLQGEDDDPTLDGGV